MISAGIEKLYTWAQFFTVQLLSLSLLSAGLIGVFILTRPYQKKGKLIFGLLHTAFLLYLLSELALSVAPSHEAVAVRLYLNTGTLGLLCRVFPIFTCCIPEKTEKVIRIFPRALFIAAESFLFTLIIILLHSKIPLFVRADMDSVERSFLWNIFISISLCWLIRGIMDLLPEKKNGCRLFAAGVIIASAGYILEQTIPGNRYFLIFPAALTLSVVMSARALFSGNFLQLLFEPVDKLLHDIEITILVISDEGEIISYNRDRIGFFSFKECKTLSSLTEEIRKYAASELETFPAVQSVPPAWASLANGTVKLVEDDKELILEYSMEPVRYRGGRIAGLLSFLDITEKMETIRTLKNKEEALEKSYRELSAYSKSDLYLKAEKMRENLLRQTNSSLEKDLADLSEMLEAEADIEKLTAEARNSLAKIRKAVTKLKNSSLEVEL